MDNSKNMCSYNEEIIKVICNVNKEYINKEIIFYNSSMLHIDFFGNIMPLNFEFLSQNDAKWLVGFSSNFKKSLEKYSDKKLKGKILEAIQQISEDPVNKVGNTVKPLSGNLQGKWRYRIGDYRLIYEPKMNEREIVLIVFAPRAEVYTI